jgi:AraC-like DNA-binding protein
MLPACCANADHARGGYSAEVIRVQDLAVSVPGVRAFHWQCDEPYTGVKSFYAVARVDRGHTAYRAGGKQWTASPGTIVLKQPGDVHRDHNQLAVAMHVVVLPTQMIEPRAFRMPPQLAANDERAAAFHRLHDAIASLAERLVVEVALAEAVAALTQLAPRTTRPIRRAVELLHARVAEAVTLDELAAEVGLDKFHFCHAFRAQLGIPPYAYLTELRIARAKQLLAAGTRPCDVAPQVGLYDQSQLNRHFRRLVGVTPGAYQSRIVR